jgi:hypothetical protein
LAEAPFLTWLSVNVSTRPWMSLSIMLPGKSRFAESVWEGRAYVCDWLNTSLCAPEVHRWSQDHVA